jgi:flagellar basal-body rod protein FlgF
MNVGLYSGAAGMRIGEDYQQMISENLSLGSVPGYKQSLPVFSTDTAATATATGDQTSNSTASIKMTRAIDFSQGAIQPTGNPYNLAIEGKGFFAVKEANGTTSYTRNGAFSVTARGQLLTSDGATVLGKGGSPIAIDTTLGGSPTIGTDGTISIDGAAQGAVGVVHFDNPSTSLQPAAYGRFLATHSSDVKQGLASGDQVLQGSVEQSNSNPIEQMADMIQAARLYEANSKSMKAVDDSQNQLINALGGQAQA